MWRFALEKVWKGEPPSCFHHVSFLLCLCRLGLCFIKVSAVGRAVLELGWVLSGSFAGWLP